MGPQNAVLTPWIRPHSQHRGKRLKLDMSHGFEPLKCEMSVRKLNVRVFQQHQSCAQADGEADDTVAGVQNARCLSRLKTPAECLHFSKACVSSSDGLVFRVQATF